MFPTVTRQDEPVEYITEADRLLPEELFLEKCRRIALRDYQLAVQDPPYLSRRKKPTGIVMRCSFLKVDKIPSHEKMKVDEIHIGFSRWNGRK